MATFTKGKFKRKSMFNKDGIHIGTMITAKDGGTLGIIETKHLNYLSKQFRKIINTDKIKEHFEINYINMKWEYIITSYGTGLVFGEYGDEIDVWGYKDFENDTKPSFTKRLYLESKVESDVNLCVFYNCINEFNKSN